APGVVYHSIIANIRHKPDPEKITDGFIDYQSAHLDGAASECIVPGNHFCEASADVIAEVRRILTVHLAESSETCRSLQLEAPVSKYGTASPAHLRSESRR